MALEKQQQPITFCPMFSKRLFVNADEIARGLSPFNPQGVAFQAGRIMLERLEQLTGENKSFSFETTLSGLTYLNFLRKARVRGYGITFFYIYLNSVNLAIERVAIRVSKGGAQHPKRCN